MYVNDLTLDMGERGRRAVELLLGTRARIRMTRAVILSAVRTPGRPLRRRARRHAPRRPRGARRSGRRRSRRRAGRSRSRTSGSAARTRRARTTATSRAWPSCSRGCPETVAGVTVNRLCASGLAAIAGACHAVIAGDGDLFVAGGVESMSRAPLVTAKPDEAVRARRPHALRHDARLALPEPAPGGALPARVDGRDGRERRRPLHRLARGSGRVRAALAGALGGRRRRGPLRRRARAGRRRHARRASARRHVGREARSAEARVPRERQRHRRQLVGPERRRRRARDRVGGEGTRARRSSRSARSSLPPSRASTRA